LSVDAVHAKPICEDDIAVATNPLGTLGGVVSVGVVLTVKFTPLLPTLLTVTSTFPEVAPVGTRTAMLVALQFVGVATVPLNFTVLAPCVGPKFAPVIATELPTTPLLGFSPVILGAEAAFAAVLEVMSPLVATFLFASVDLTRK
jgi:hypothetical protein